LLIIGRIERFQQFGGQPGFPVRFFASPRLTYIAIMSHLFQSVPGLGQYLVYFILGGFAVYLVVKRTDEPLKILIKALVTLPLVYYSFHLAHAMGPNGLFAVMIGALIVAIIWAPHLGDLVAGPLMGLFDGGNESPEKKPLYSTALAKRKKGDYQGAIDEVGRQLRQFPDDLEGTMWIAAIQAEDLYDLPAASHTLEGFCNRPQTSPKHAASARMALADWYLQIHADVESAEMTLQKILTRNPDTDFAALIKQRLAHLVDARDTILKQRRLDNIAVPAGVKNMGLLDSQTVVLRSEENMDDLAKGFLAHLQDHPNDTDIREKLALLYSRDFKRLDLAVLELEQLIGQPGCSSRQISGWLNLLATIQIEHGTGLDSVRATLERILELFPNLSFAETARRRIELLNNEFKGQKKTSTVKLGVYEQNIGLKYGQGK
jgi:tetratricopeptide (TPR) repeat protein